MKVVKEREIAAMKGDMTAIPSMSIEKLLDKAKSSPNLSSVQLQEALENAGLVHYEIGEADAHFFYFNFNLTSCA